MCAPPTKVGTHNSTISDNAKPVVCASAVTKYQVRCTNCATYETAWTETTLTILKVVENTWVCKLKDAEIFYMNVAPMDLLENLQLSCTGKHVLDLLALHNEMQKYHV